MTRKRKAIYAAVSVIALAGGGAGVAQAVGGNDEKDAAVTGPDADRAKAAALKAVGGGTAGNVERDGEKGATWEVEVKKPDGSTVDVRLDGAFAKVAVDGDTESGPEKGEKK